MREVKSPPIRVMLAVGETCDGDALLRICAGRETIEVVGLAQEGTEAARLAAQLLPDVVLLDEQIGGMDGLATAAAISLAAPQVATILLTKEDPASRWREAIRAGVKDIVRDPPQPAELLAAIDVVQRARERRETHEFQALVDPSLAPRVIAIAGAKGGVGKTTLAVNLGVLLARRHPGQVVLVDLYSQFGDVGLMLNLQAKRTLVDLVPLTDELDQDLVEAHLTPHDSGLKVMVGSNSPTQLDLIGAKALRSILLLLKRSYRFIVLDVPPVLYETTTCALTHATAVALVANLFDLTTLNDTRKLHDLLIESYVPEERIHVVLNRVARGNRLRLEEIERALGRNGAITIPNAAGLAVTAINEGKPFVASHPEAAVSRSIEVLADRLAGATEANAVALRPLARPAPPPNAVPSQAT